MLFRIARVLQERSRELAVAESLDGGKPIKESRDVDLPLAAAHFFYYAGWADKLEYAFPGPAPAAARRRRADRALELPAADARVEDRSGARVREHRRAQAGGDDAADRAPVRRRVPAGAGAAGSRQHRHGRRLDRRAPGAEPFGIDKVAFTGSTEVGKAIQRELAGRGIALTLELGGKAANIVFDDCALDQAVEGIVNGIYFNQGHVCCAGSRLLVQESIHDQLVRKLKRRMATLRVGDPLDKNTDIGAINSKAQLDRITELVESGTEEGAEIYQPPCRLPEKGWWFAPTVFTNVAQSHRIASEEIFGPVLSVLTFRTPDEAVEKANNTMYGLSAGVWTEKGSRILWMADRLRAGVVWGNTFNRFDPASPFGGYKESGFGREGGRHGLEAYLRFVVSARLAVRKTYKLFIGGAFPRSESGRTLELEGHNVARASRKDVRDAVVAARKGFAAWSTATAYNRGQVLYRLAETMETRNGALAAVCSGRREVARAIDRVVWYAGWADKLAQVLGSSNPVAGPYFNFTLPEPTGVVAVIAPDEPALDGLVARVVAGARRRQRRGGRRLREPSARRDRARRGGRDVGRARRRRQRAHRASRRARARARVPHGRQRDRRDRRDGDSAPLEVLAAENVKRVVRAREDRSPWEIAAFMEMKTVWHPIGR